MGRDSLLQVRKKIVVVTDSFKKKLISRGIPAEKIAVIKNGVNKALFSPMPKDKTLIDELGLKGKKVVGYIGTHGMAHKLDFIIRQAKEMDGKNDFHFYSWETVRNGIIC